MTKIRYINISTINDQNYYIEMKANNLTYVISNF